MSTKGVNKVIILGNLGQDPEVKCFQNGSSVTSISVATSESWKNKETGATESKTEWHRVQLFNKLGEIASQYLAKGSKVYIEGSLKTRKWQDKEGKDCYMTEIVAHNLQMLDSKSNFEKGDSTPSVYKSEPRATQADKVRNSPVPEDFDDDIPF